MLRIYEKDIFLNELENSLDRIVTLSFELSHRGDEELSRICSMFAYDFHIEYNSEDPPETILYLYISLRDIIEHIIDQYI